MAVPNHKRTSIIKNFVMVSEFGIHLIRPSTAEDHYEIFFNTFREFMIVAELSDGKTL